MNIILVDEEELCGGQLSISDHRATHIRKVLRASVGDRLRIGVVNGMMGSGTITAIGKGRGTPVCLDVVLDKRPAPVPAIDIILALPRPIMLRRILSQVAALGVGTLFIIHANRVEKSYWESGLFDGLGYVEHLRLGIEQAVDTRLPNVMLFEKFKKFVDEYLPQVAGGYQSRLIAHPYGSGHLADCLDDGSGRVLLAIGPEGGWVDFEVDKFQSLGFRACSLGERILKVDTAVVAFHAAISAIREMQMRIR